MSTPKYNIYPSLLSKFQDLLDYEKVAEEPWNRTKDDGYKLTPDEMYERLERELLDMVNRAPKGPMEAADKGTAFNEVIDCLIERRPCSYEGMKIKSMLAGRTKKTIVIRAWINGFTFDFDLDFCRRVASQFKGSLTQFKAKGYMQTHYGLVHLYGYIDEWVGNRMYDIKTTEKYTFGKFARGWQRHLYPWCVVESGETTEVADFTYYVVEWSGKGKTAPLKGTVYTETYTYDHQGSGGKLREMLELFIEWLEAHRELITDKKIFNLEQ